MHIGSNEPSKYDLSSLKICAVAGETIKTPEWNWYYEKVGNRNCPVIDSFWQTETGSMMISP